MSTEYAERKTREIMTKVNGQAKLAEQAMRTLIQRDPAFLYSLVEPYLNGILIHAIERSRKAVPETKLQKPMPSKPSSPATPIKKSVRPAATQAVGSGGMDSLMKAWAKSFEQSAPDAPKEGGKKVSADHLKAMQALIKKKPF